MLRPRAVAATAKAVPPESEGMDENSSLTDFAGDDPPAEEADPGGVTDDGGGEVSGAGGEGPGGDADATDGADDDAVTDESVDASVVDDAVDPAVSTYRWSPGGEACADCGETVERRWLDGEAYVCGDCKEW
jgi:hypothetical protein